MVTNGEPNTPFKVASYASALLDYFLFKFGLCADDAVLVPYSTMVERL
jgi:hypothetical protein